MDSENKMQIENMKNYCEMAIKLEREAAMWQKMLKEANSKMQSFDQEHQSLGQLISQTQSELASLNTRFMQETSSKKLEMKKRKRNCTISMTAIVMLTIFILLIGVSMAGVAGNGTAGQTVALVAGMLMGGVSLLGVPYIICIIVFAVNKSKVNSLIKETGDDFLKIKETKARAVLQDKYEKARNELAVVTNSKMFIRDQQSELKKSLDAALERRQQFYSIGVIARIYQNLEAVTSFFFYLDTGRVNVIDGSGGLWDTYEKDCQHKEQMQELRGIRGAIEEHERHEQMRHRELIGTLHSMEQNIRSSLGRIEGYTAETARNSAISAAANIQQEEYLEYMATTVWRRDV